MKSGTRVTFGFILALFLAGCGSSPTDPDNRIDLYWESCQSIWEVGQCRRAVATNHSDYLMVLEVYSKWSTEGNKQWVLEDRSDIHGPGTLRYKIDWYTDNYIGWDFKAVAYHNMPHTNGMQHKVVKFWHGS